MTSLLEFHAFLLSNTGTRLDRFARAFAATIRPGDTVLDLGAGSGILSILACRAGARRVYAVEDSDAVAIAHAMIAGTPFRDRIEILHARSFDVSLPEPVDVITGDVHSTFGLQERGLSAMIDARQRLMKPGGRVVPARMQICVAPADAPELYASKVDYWRTVAHDVRLDAVRDLAVNTLHPARLTPAQLLAPPAAVCTIDFASVSGLHAGGRATLRVARAGTVHGLCGGIVTSLVDGVEISNLPGDPGTSNFAHAFLPLDTPVPVTEGDGIDVDVDIYDGDELRWIVTITAAGSGATRRFTHATFLSRPLSRESLRQRDPAYRPALTPRGRLERDLLNQMDGTRTLADLEQWLAADQDPALSRERRAQLLATTIERCG